MKRFWRCHDGALPPLLALALNPGLDGDMFSPHPLVAALKARASADDSWRPTTFPRGASLMRQGEPRDSLFVLTEGLVKLTYLSAQGDEWIKSVIVDQGLFGSLGGLEAGSRFGATLVEASTIVELPGQWLRRALAEDSSIAAGSAAFLGWLAERKQAREEALLCQTAEDRYRTLLVDEPALLARLPQGDVARFLRVTPVAFSKIKRRMRLP